jgi:nitrate/nitrite transporter NarK
MIVLGAAFVLVPAALWPSVGVIVERRMVGTAYGVMSQIQNVGLFAFPYLNGWIRERTGDYRATQLVFAGLGVLALVFAVDLKRADREHGGTLERADT